MKTVLNLRLLLLILAMNAGSARAEDARLLDAELLEATRAEVRTNHPTVAAAQARVQAAEFGIRAVRLWEDPMAGAGVMTADLPMRQDNGDLLFSLEQVLPRRKLYRAMKDKASAERSVMQAETQSAIVGLELLTAQTLIELALADELLNIETNQVRWLETMAANAREKMKDPSSSASEALRIESELAQERQKLDSSQRQRLRLLRQLNILLGRPADQAWPRLRLPDSTGATPALSEVMDRLVQSNPMLHALFHTSSAARAEIEVARRERAPIFSVGVDTSTYSGGDFRQATFGAKVTLPFFNKSVYKAAVDRAERQQAAADREAEALERRLRGELVAAQTEAESAAQQAATFAREVIPRAERAAESTQNAWISSKATLLEVLESRRGMLNARMEERRSVAAQTAALETLRSIVPPSTNPSISNP